MSGMLDSVGSFFQTTLGNVPLAVLTIALLATPTIIYLIYRLSVPTASHGRARSSAPAGAQWVCPRCRSVNDLQSSRCYHCEFRVDDAGDDLLVIDSMTAKPIILPPPVVERPAVAVGPGPQPTAAPPVVVPFSVPSGPAPAQPSGPGPATSVPIPAAPAAPGVPVGPGPTRVPAAPISGVAIASAVGARRPFDTMPVPTPVGSPIGASPAPAVAVTAAAAPRVATPVVARPIVVAASAPAPSAPAPSAPAPSPAPAREPVVPAPEPVAPPAPEPTAAAAATVAATAPEPAAAAIPTPASTTPTPPDDAARPTPRPIRPAPRLIVSVPLPDQTAESDEAPPAG
jgi:hypothetical protein